MTRDQILEACQQIDNTPLDEECSREDWEQVLEQFGALSFNEQRALIVFRHALNRSMAEDDPKWTINDETEALSTLAQAIERAEGRA